MSERTTKIDIINLKKKKKKNYSSLLSQQLSFLAHYSPRAGTMRQTLF